MDRVGESKDLVVIPTNVRDQSPAGNSEKNSGLEKETAILVEPEKPKDSSAVGGDKEGGGYASYVVSQSSGVQYADSLYDEALTGQCRSYGGTRRHSTQSCGYAVF
jgi:hypothetical protein